MIPLKKVADLQILPSDLVKLICDPETLGRFTEEEMERMMITLSYELHERDQKHANRNH
jgi:hypothetical protein